MNRVGFYRVELKKVIGRGWDGRGWVGREWCFIGFNVKTFAS